MCVEGTLILIDTSCPSLARCGRGLQESTQARNSRRHTIQECGSWLCLAARSYTARVAAAAALAAAAPATAEAASAAAGVTVACSSSGVAAGGATAGTTGRRLHTTRARADSAAAQLLATTRPRWLARGEVGRAVHRPAGAVTRYIRRSRCLHSRLCITIVRLMEASVQALHEASEALKCNIQHKPTSADIRLLLEVNVTIAELALKQREHARDERTRSQAPLSSGAPGGAQRDTDTRS